MDSADSRNLQTALAAQGTKIQQHATQLSTVGRGVEELSKRQEDFQASVTTQRKADVVVLPLNGLLCALPRPQIRFWQTITFWHDTDSAGSSYICGQGTERINLSVPVQDRFFNNGDTRQDFRLSRDSLAVLLNLLHQDRRHGWGATIETLVFLFWLASGASYRVVSRVFGMPRSTVHRIVHRVTGEVVAIRHKVIHFPKTAEDLAAGWQDRAFLKAAGAIDGCHVRIKPPSGPDGPFVDVYVGWPGSVQDSRVLRHSPLYRQAVYSPPGHFILADGGYPCLQHPLPLITPYKRPLQGVGPQRFNGHHSRARSIIERAFGMMKTRFRAILLQALEVHHTFVPQVITACAVLHNICLGVGDIMPPEDKLQDAMPEDEGENGLEAVSGAPWRDRLSVEVSALEEVIPDHDYL
ncbi:Protein ALP1-like [Merluccius polli]|uniref:Protein ALP1-like n=1 Tax=Merluccius polli TaxID=89951 RepID=A0AA47N5S3_MERPO|nr:Protein ALP1-like [Merluccius polli]